MKTNFWIFNQVMFVAVLLLSGAISQARPCSECRKIEALKADYEKSSRVEGLEHDQVANKITDLIKSIKKHADGTVEPVVIDTVISILRVDAKDRWFRQLFVEKNYAFFRDNRDAFRERLKKLPEKEAKEINEDIDFKFREMEFGNDPGKKTLSH